MSRKLTATAAASALLVLTLATSAADAWTLPAWLQRGESASAPATHVATAAPSAAAPVSVAPLSAGQMPNYRAIVQ